MVFCGHTLSHISTYNKATVFNGEWSYCASLTNNHLNPRSWPNTKIYILLVKNNVWAQLTSFFEVQSHRSHSQP